jgi:hypothetical protein
VHDDANAFSTWNGGIATHISDLHKFSYFAVIWSEEADYTGVALSWIGGNADALDRNVRERATPLFSALGCVSNGGTF